MPNETYDWDAARDRLRKQTEEQHPEAWLASEDDAEFFGIFRRLKRAPSKYGMTPVAIFEDPKTGHLRSVWLHHTVLRNQLYELRPEVGEVVFIRYMGREVNEAGNDYANYRTAVDGRSQGMSWNAVLTGPTEEDHARTVNPDPGPGADFEHDPGADDIPF